MTATSPDRVGSAAASRAHFPCFDGLRAVAAIAVVFTHVSFVTTANRQWGGSYLARLDSGVAIFFVISGFLLYRPFVSRVLSGDPLPRTGAYLWRRALRIYPAYWIAAVVVGVVFGVSRWDGIADAASHLALVHIYDPDTVVSGPISQAWSLGTELGFYLALPLLARVARAIAARTDRRVRPQLLFVAALIATGLTYRWAVFTFADGRHAAAYATWLPGFLDQFGLGMALAVVSSAGDTERGPRWLAEGSVVLALASLTVAAFAIGLPPSSLAYSTSSLLLRQVTYGLFGFFLMLPGVFGDQDRGPVRAVLRSAPMRWLGLVSYGIYLWHQFFVDRFQRWTDTPEFAGQFGQAIAIVLVGSVAAATVSYVAAERPLLSLKGRVPQRDSTPAGVGLAT